VVDTDVLHLDRKQSASFRGSNISFIFQDFNLIPVLTVYENIEYPLLMVQSAPYLLCCAGLFRSGQGQLWQLALSERQRSGVYRSVR
jgi:ABC-type lipoprotein export system ATPase subunit